MPNHPNLRKHVSRANELVCTGTFGTVQRLGNRVFWTADGPVL